MWTAFVEILGQPWVVTVTALLGAAFSVVFGFLHRRRLFRVMDKIARNTEPRERDDERPAKPPASARDPDNSPIVPAATGRSTSATEERPPETPVPPTRFTQRQFDEELRRLLREKRERGDNFAEIVSGNLHRRVVGGSGPNRMPMACNAMWKLWKRQGSKEENVIYTTPSRRSSTIRIRYDLMDLE